MLRSLSIRDIVVFDRLDLELAGGLCVLTGETGAGKSILLDALGLATGKRADGRLVRQGQDRGVVIAEFDPPTSGPVPALLAAQEIDGGAELILRRTLGADGRSRAFVNDSPVSVGFLARLGEALVEVHGQAAEAGLLRPANHRDILDRFAAAAGILARVQTTHGEWRAACERLAAMQSELVSAEREEEELRHAVEELTALAPEEGEDEKLTERRAFLMQAERLAEALGEATAALEGDGGVARRLRGAERALDKLRTHIGKRLDEAVAALGRAAVEAEEAAAAVAALGVGLDTAPEEIEQVEERLFALRALARKHRVDAADLHRLADRMAARLSGMVSRRDELESARKAAEAARQAYMSASGELSQIRKDAARRLDAAVQSELGPLRMGETRFTTRIETLAEENWGEYGIDRPVFEVATIPGAPPGPIGRIASGGELSRLMLALKVALAEVGDAPVLIFDEVDRGVGGATADAVGVRLQGLSQHFQVLVVTHSPQVAARGRRHWLIARQNTGAATATGVRQIDGEQRREEIARMLSGAQITGEARAAADRLLEGRPQ